MGGIEDNYGYSVALSMDGLILAVGANKHSSAAPEAGQVQTYKYNSVAKLWEQIGQDLIGEKEGDEFGVSVALSAIGHVLAVGAYWHNLRKDEPNAGQVRVYVYDSGDNTWAQLGQSLDGEEANDQFGWSVALPSDGTIVAAGADEHDGNGRSSGTIRAFRYSNDTGLWTKLGASLDGESEGDDFGISVALSADGFTLAGGSNRNDAKGNDAGHVRVFQFRP